MDLGKEDKIDLIKDKIISLIRYSVEDRARLHSHNTGFNLCKPEREIKPGQVLGHWMSLILVSGESLRMTIKLHYNLYSVKEIAYHAYGKGSAEELSDKQAIDFMKELCNLSAGLVVKIFEESNLPLGMSLPLCARGFNEIFSDYTPAVKPFVKFSDLWSLKCDTCVFMMSSVVEMLDTFALRNILKYEIPLAAAGSDDGEMDFL